MKGIILSFAAGAAFLAIGLTTAITVTGDEKRSTAVKPRATGCTRSGTGFYEDNPIYHDPTPIAWKHGRPETTGLDPVFASTGAPTRWAGTRERSLLVVRHGSLVMEHYFHGAGRQDSANVHSASKSILRILTGIAVDSGYEVNGRRFTLDTRLVSLLPEYFTDVDPLKRDITVRNLVEMSAGLSWTEDESEEEIETEPDWTAAILSRDMSPEGPGESFLYNTGLTHLLAVVLTRVTGQSLWDFAHDRLFGPMGIAPEHWGRDPQGICSGGYNMYLTPRELARFGQLLLRDGVWNGRRLVSASTIAESSQRIWRDDSEGNWYGQLFRVNTISGVKVFYAEGHGGQFVYVLPDEDIAVILTSATEAPFGDDYYDAHDYVAKYVIPAIDDEE